LQTAIDMAGEGDVILIKAGGSYTLPFFTARIDGKSLQLIAEPGAYGFGRIRVTALGAQQSVTLRGFKDRTAFLLNDNAGSILLEDCEILNLTLQNSAAVGITNSAVGSVPFANDSAFTKVENSLLFGYASTFFGADGQGVFFGVNCQVDLAPTPGQSAIELLSGGLFLFGSQVQGGDGGSGLGFGGCHCTNSANGADALSLSAGTEAVTLETSLVGGVGGPGLGFCVGGSNGGAVGGAGLHTPLGGRTGACRVASPVASGQPVALEVDGPPGFRVFLTYARELAPVYVPERKGYSVVDPNSPLAFLGTVPSSGVLALTLPFPPLGRFEQAAVYHLQAKLYDPQGDEAILGAPTTLFVLRDPCP
jgi:hypothetical protein